MMKPKEVTRQARDEVVDKFKAVLSYLKKKEKRKKNQTEGRDYLSCFIL